MKGESGKAPSLQWYFKDWLADRQLQRSKPSTRGIWMNLLMYMIDCNHEKVDCRAGRLEDLSIAEICQLGGCSEVEAWDFLDDAIKHEFCDLEMDKNRTFHVMSRRLSRDASKRYKWRKQKQEQRNKGSKTGDVRHDVRRQSNTSPSLSPTPTPRIPPQTPPGGLSEKYSKSFIEFWKVCPWKVGKDAAFKVWQSIGAQNNGTSPKILINAMISQVAKGHFLGRDGSSYPPKPENWLRDGRWNDEVINKSTSHHGSGFIFPKCQACGMQASNIRSGEQCPFCNKIA